MDRETLLGLLLRQPFEPFVLKLSSGESLEVRHPEIAALGKSRLVVIDPKSDRMIITALLHIASIETAQAN